MRARSGAAARAEREGARVAYAPVSYEQTISDVVKVVEAVGAGIMVLGGLGAFVVFVPRVLRGETPQPYDSSFAILGACEGWLRG